MNYFRLPQGVQDVLPEECRCFNAIKARLLQKFEQNGYEPVASASLEYFETFSNIRNAVPEERLFKLSDNGGKLLVLRPDTTLSISRIAATKLPEAKRLCYVTTKFDMQEAGGISSREIEQAGVERFGEEGAFSDAQTVAFAVECMKEVGISDFVLDIGHVGYFKGILEECGLSREEEELVRGYINRKDGMNAERILKRAGVKPDALNTVLALPALFGGAEVLDRAAALTKNQTALSAAARLKEVYALLSEMGYEKYVCFDLGTVRSLSYYSGMVFSGLVKGLGAPVLSGGRYDFLADDFGKHIPAVGFAIGLKRVLIALERQGNLPESKPLEFIIVCEKGAEKAGYAELLRRTQQGGRGKLLGSYFEDTDTAALKEEAATVLIATKQGMKTL